MKQQHANKPAIHIGTSGWHYTHWKGPYYPEKMHDDEMLDFYLRDFRTVEINNSFYHLPSAETFEAWRDSVPLGFLFSVKGSRYTTHMKKLKDPVSSTEKFFNNLKHLGDKCGPVLYQLPPHWRVNVDRFAAFLDVLPHQYRFAFEFREPSWYCEEIYELLEQYHAAFCIYELAGHHSPIIATSNLVYIRLHGPTPQKYQGSYSRDVLEEWRDRILDWQNEGRTVYCYFDNDQYGYAVQNAKTLIELIGSSAITAH